MGNRQVRLVQLEIAQRRLIQLPELATELRALSAWWRPWDRATAPESYRAYRDSLPRHEARALTTH